MRLSWCEAELYAACIYGVRIYVRRGHAVLRAALPHKEEYVILVRMSSMQRKLYNAFMTVIKEGGLASWTNSNNPIKAFSVFCKVSPCLHCQQALVPVNQLCCQSRSFSVAQVLLFTGHQISWVTE